MLRTPRFSSAFRTSRFRSAIHACVLLALAWAASPEKLAGQATSDRLYLSGTDKDNTVDWAFYCTGGRNSGAWTTIPVPSCWELEGFGAYHYGTYSAEDESGLYRHSFAVPEAWEGRRVYIVFEGVMTDATVKLNGHSAGPTHRGAFYRFRYDVSGLLDYGADNLLEVTVDKSSSQRSINEAERQADYWVFGGIFRPVYLLSEPAEAIDALAIDAQADGTLRVQAELLGIAGADRLTTELRTLEGDLVATLPEQTILPGSSIALTEGTVAGVNSWSPEFPNLYEVQVRLYENESLVHVRTETVGFRTFEIREGDGLYLNGEKIRMKGVNRHAFWPDSGRTTSPELDEADVRLIKDLNMNAVRMSHYPPDKSFLEACDRLGLLVLNELAGWQYAYSTVHGRPLVKEMVLRDRNHPSVVWWANGNEGGHNLALVDDFVQWDPLQQRPVIIPTNSDSPILNGVKTRHYPDYNSLVNDLQGPDLYMPTEMLHGLYDGGHGAGLKDYWEAIRNAPLGAGFFLWNLADEGIVRTDRDGALDTEGDRGADGITGPYREKEGSYRTVRRLLSPIQLPEALPEVFEGSLSVENQFAFTDLSECTFEWVLLDLTLEAESVVAEGSQPGPALAPRSTGTLMLSIPVDFAQHDALRVHAYDPHGRLVETWTWPLTGRSEWAARLIDEGSGEITVAESEQYLDLAAGNVAVRIRKDNARLQRVLDDGIDLGFTNGPRVVTTTGTANSILTSLTHGYEGANYVVEGSFTGAMSSVRWTLTPSGWLKLEYAYTLGGQRADGGIAFDYPEQGVQEIQWMGHGPDRVWKNRLTGPDFGQWSKVYNTTRTGQEWGYPEFKGYHRGVVAAKLEAAGRTLTTVLLSDELYYRLFTPDDANSGRTGPNFPEGSLGFMHAIPGIGTKFKSSGSLGPSGQQTQLSGPQSGEVWFHFEADSSYPGVLGTLAPDNSGAVGFVASEAFNDSGVASLTWSFGDGSPLRITSSRETHYSYLAGGDYTVRVTARDSLGNELFFAETEVSPSVIYEEATPDGDLLARWGFDDPVARGNDDSGSGHNLAASPFAVVTPGKDSAAALAFNVSGNRARWNNAGTYLNGLDALTIALWVRAGQTGLDIGFLGGANPTGADNNLGIRYDIQGFESGGVSLIKAALRVRDVLGGNHELNLETASNTQSAEWQHITLAWESGEALTLYIDGVKQTPLFNSAPVEGVVHGVGALTLGEGSQRAGLWPGSVDNVRIYRRLLTEAEVAELPSAGVPTANMPPMVSAGEEMTVVFPGADTQLSGVVSDPDSSGILTSYWEVFSGPGSVQFQNAASPVTTASFSQAGTYVLRLIGSDGASAAHDFVTVTVEAGAPPGYSAWAAQYFPDLDAPEAQETADFDGDGMTNKEEYLAGTDPTDGASYLQIWIDGESLPAAIRVRFAPVFPGRIYTLEYGKDLKAFDFEHVPTIDLNTGTGSFIFEMNDFDPLFVRLRCELESE